MSSLPKTTLLLKGTEVKKTFLVQGAKTFKSKILFSPKLFETQPDSSILKVNPFLLNISLFSIRRLSFPAVNCKGFGLKIQISIKQFKK